jgi:hypothetical protein
MINPETYTFSASEFVKAFEMLACLSSDHDFVRVTVDVGDEGADVVLQAFACEGCVDAAIAAVDDELMQSTARHRSPDWAL